MFLEIGAKNSFGFFGCAITVVVAKFDEPGKIARESPICVVHR
jgi:hypothetical protein